MSLLAAEWRESSAIYRTLTEPSREADAEIARQLAQLNTFGQTMYPLAMHAYRGWQREFEYVEYRDGHWDQLDEGNFLYMGWDSKYMLTAVQGVLEESGLASEVFVKYSYIGAAM